MINDVEHFFFYVLAICLSSFVKCWFRLTTLITLDLLIILVTFPYHLLALWLRESLYSTPVLDIVFSLFYISLFLDLLPHFNGTYPLIAFWARV
jgi:hypothetical protein